MEDLKVKLIHELYEIGAIKFEEITLKTGVKSPIYFDLRLTMRYPQLVNQIIELMWLKIYDKCQFDLIVGVPFGALIFAAFMSKSYNLPMIVKRSSPKEYGTKRLIEGIFNKNEKALVIEDVVTSGLSILETIKSLNQVELKVEDVITCIDREQNAVQNLAKHGIRLHCVLSLTEIIDELTRSGKVTSTKSDQIKDWIKASQTTF